MHRIMMDILDENVLDKLESLQQKHLIKIVENVETDSPALVGKPMSIAAFKAWVNAAEKTPTISLEQAKAKWAKQKEVLLGHTK